MVSRSTDMPFHNLSLCSGGAGLDLGLEIVIRSARTVGYVEREAFAVEYLCSLMDEGALAEAPVWSDVATFNGRPWRGAVDCITAGYPCQPFSLAGNRGGKSDPRHLWHHIARIVGEVQPGIVFAENVAGHVSLGFDCVAADLQGMGYRVAAGLFKASEVGGSHHRTRLFILALADTVNARRRRCSARRCRMAGVDNCLPPQWHENTGDLGSGGEEIPILAIGPDDSRWDEILARFPDLAPAQPHVQLVVDGLANDRRNFQRLAGNGVCPLQAAYAFTSLFAALTVNQ